jgi:hypothetical protein
MRKIASLSVGMLLLLWSLGLSSFLPDAAAGDVDGCMKESLVAVGDTPIRGNAFLCVDPNGVHVELHTRALTHKNAYTIWFIYIDDPSQCPPPGNCAPDPNLDPCKGPLDLRGFDPLGVIGRLDSAVAPRNGKMTFAGRIGGLRLSSGSQVLLFMAGHGRADARDYRARARQLLTPEDPILGAPGLGNCVDGAGVEEVVLALFTRP